MDEYALSANGSHLAYITQRIRKGRVVDKRGTPYLPVLHLKNLRTGADRVLNWSKRMGGHATESGPTQTRSLSPSGLSVSRGGRYVSVYEESGRTAATWIGNTRSGRWKPSWHDMFVSHTAPFTDDGRYLITRARKCQKQLGFGRLRLRAWRLTCAGRDGSHETDSGRSLWTFDRDIQVDTTGRFAALFYWKLRRAGGARDHKFNVYRYDFATRTLERRAMPSDYEDSLGFTPDGSAVLVSATTREGQRTWSTYTFATKQLTPLPSVLCSQTPVVSRDGSILWVQMVDEAFQVMRSAGPSAPATPVSPLVQGGITLVDVSANGRIALATFGYARLAVLRSS